MNGTSGLSVLQSMQDFIPPGTRRVILDIPMDDVVKMYVEAIADERMFKIELMDLLRGATVVTVDGELLSGEKLRQISGQQLEQVDATGSF